MKKPEKTLHCVYIFNNRLAGISDPNRPDYGTITTQIIRRDGDTVETKNTIYHVASWL